MNKKEKNNVINEVMERLDNIHALISNAEVEPAKELVIIHQDKFSEISSALHGAARDKFLARDKIFNSNFRDLELAATNVDYIVKILFGRDKAHTKENENALTEQRKLVVDAGIALGSDIAEMKNILTNALEKSPARENNN